MSNQISCMLYSCRKSLSLKSRSFQKLKILIYGCVGYSRSCICLLVYLKFRSTMTEIKPIDEYKRNFPEPKVKSNNLFCRVCIKANWQKFQIISSFLQIIKNNFKSLKAVCFWVLHQHHNLSKIGREFIKTEKLNQIWDFSKQIINL